MAIYLAFCIRVNPRRWQQFHTQCESKSLHISTPIHLSFCIGIDIPISIYVYEYTVVCLLTTAPRAVRISVEPRNTHGYISSFLYKG